VYLCTLVNRLLCTLVDRLLCTLVDRLLCTLVDRLLCTLVDRLLCTLVEGLLCTLVVPLLCTLVERLLCTLVDRLLCTLVAVCCVHWSRKVHLSSSAPQPSTKVLCHVELIFHIIMSRLKPISLSNFVSPPVDNPANANATPAPACPPVTGWRGNYGPVRNNFDDSGFFRGRTDSAGKRRRTETKAEIDAAYDLSRDFLTNNPPPPKTRS
jgi:hypothetical protein